MQLGDTVFVTVTDGDTDTVCPAVVTKVWTKDDANGDSAWWDAVKDKGIVSLVAFVPGAVPLVVFDASIKAVSYEDDAGRTRIQHGTYQERVRESSTVVTTPQTPPVPQAAPEAPLVPTPPAPVPTPVSVPQDTGTVTDASDGWTLTPPTPAS